MDSASTRWVVGLIPCVGVAVLLGLGNHLPQHFGFILAGGAFASGAILGWRGLVPVYLGTAVYGLTLLLSGALTPSGAEDQSGNVLLYFSFYPALFTVPTAAGVLTRQTTRLARRR